MVQFSEEKVMTAFSECMQAAGISPPAAFLPDGKIHRFDIFNSGRKKALAGWYSLHCNGVPAGVFGDWSNPSLGKIVWTAKNTREMTPDELHAHQKRMADIASAAEAERKERALKASDEVRKIWDTSKTSGSDHPYLRKKGISALGDVRINAAGSLIIPVCNSSGELLSIQYINGDGSKKFHPGAALQSGFFTIPGKNDVIAIAEGYGTGCSVYEATGHTVIVAFNAGRLEKIAKEIRNQHPVDKIVICADNDRHTEGNPGLTAGKAAAEAVGGVLVFPEFTDKNNKGTDFNDMAALSGIKSVHDRIQAAIEDEQQSLSKLAYADLSGWITELPPAIKYVYDGLLTRRVVGAVCAQGGTGKSYFLEALTLCSVMGIDCFNLFKPVKPLRVLAAFVEDPAEITRSRMYAIGSTFYDIKKQDIQSAINDRLRLICEPIGALAQYDAQKNPEPSAAFFLLLDAVEKFNPDVIFLDPKAQIYGLDENNNDHATYWVNLLKRLCNSGASVLFSHHTPKNVSAFDLAGLRGGGGLGDACRFAIGMQHLDDSTAKTYGLESPDGYVHMKFTKCSYSAKDSSDFFFQRGFEGELYRVDLSACHESGLSDALLELIQRHYASGGESLTPRDIVRGKAGQEIRNDMADKFGKKTTGDSLNRTIQRLLLGKVLTLVPGKRAHRDVDFLVVPGFESAKAF